MNKMIRKIKLFFARKGKNLFLLLLVSSLLSTLFCVTIFMMKNGNQMSEVMFEGVEIELNVLHRFEGEGEDEEIRIDEWLDDKAVTKEEYRDFMFSLTERLNDFANDVQGEMASIFKVDAYANIKYYDMDENPLNEASIYGIRSLKQLREDKIAIARGEFFDEENTSFTSLLVREDIRNANGSLIKPGDLVDIKTSQGTVTFTVVGTFHEMVENSILRQEENYRLDDLDFLMEEDVLMQFIKENDLVMKPEKISISFDSREDYASLVSGLNDMLDSFMNEMKEKENPLVHYDTLRVQVEDGLFLETQKSVSNIKMAFLIVSPIILVISFLVYVVVLIYSFLKEKREVEILRILGQEDKKIYFSILLELFIILSLSLMITFMASRTIGSMLNEQIYLEKMKSQEKMIRLSSLKEEYKFELLEEIEREIPPFDEKGIYSSLMVSYSILFGLSIVAVIVVQKFSKNRIKK